MAVKIRLARRGRKKKPFYHIIVADARAPRDGKFIENLGSYNPMTKPATIEIDRDRAYDWLMKGAQPTDTVRAILRFKGVMYKKHLQVGVKKGAMTQDQADKLLADFIEVREAKIAALFEETAKERVAYLKFISGEAKVVAAVVDKDAGAEFREDAETQDNSEDTTETTEVAEDTAETTEDAGTDESTEAADTNESTEETKAPETEA